MRTLRYIFFIIAGITMWGCQQETFDYKPYEANIEDIDFIYFSAGGTSLIADGRATLRFIVEAYRTMKVTRSDGSTVDSLVLVDYEKLPEGSVNIHNSSGEKVGMTYSTTDATAGSETFYAQIGQLKSEPMTVTLRNKQTLPSKAYVNVIFHVFELDKNDPTYDVLSYQAVEERHLEEGIAYANTVFNNVIGDDPNGGVANIEFRLATEDPAGNVLNKPGYHLITYNESWKTNVWGYSVNDFINKVNATPSYGWDPDRYLNIYIIPSGANNSMGNNRPKYQIVPSGAEPIPGITDIVSGSEELPTDQFYETYGLGIPRTLLFPGTDRKIELATYMGSYYGLLRTAVSSNTATDYCNDTRKYIGTDQYDSLLKVGIDGIKFLANNAMDDNRYPSLRNCFTLDQVNRMRAVMEHCPNRAHWTLQ